MRFLFVMVALLGSTKSVEQCLNENNEHAEHNALIQVQSDGKGLANDKEVGKFGRSSRPRRRRRRHHYYYPTKSTTTSASATPTTTTSTSTTTTTTPTTTTSTSTTTTTTPTTTTSTSTTTTTTTTTTTSTNTRINCPPVIQQYLEEIPPEPLLANENRTIVLEFSDSGIDGCCIVDRGINVVTFLVYDFVPDVTAAVIVDSPSGRSEQVGTVTTIGIPSGSGQGLVDIATFGGESIKGEWKVTYIANAAGSSLAETSLFTNLEPCQ